MVFRERTRAPVRHAGLDPAFTFAFLVQWNFGFDTLIKKKVDPGSSPG
jgi:hypothetical protein